ncbi:MAG: ribosome maturation factor RimM [Chitinophagaceae bacterium]
MASYFKIGKFVSAHGLKGELILQHELGKATELKGVEALFIEDKKGSFLPYFIQIAKKKSAEEVVVQIEGVDVREKALLLASKPVWIPEEEFHRLADRSAPANLLGYAIVENKKSLGIIEEVIEQPQQLVCRILINEKEVLIPLNESTLVKINHAKKIVEVTLPEGLLNIYLS